MRILILLLGIYILSTLGGIFLVPVDAQPDWVEIVGERTQNSKKFQSTINLERFALDVSISSVHYDGPNWKDIDNTIVPSAQSVPELGLARWEMIQDDYEWFALQDFNTIPMFLFRNRSFPDSYVATAPQLLQWTNDLNQIASVSVANIGITGVVSGNTIRFPNGYGTGIDFDITLGPGRMSKTLTLQNALESPPQYILDGENASLELVQFFSLPSGPNRPNVVVDGILWDERARRETFNAVEFQIAGETIFSFAAGSAKDSGVNITRVQYILSKSGNNLKIAIRSPYTWLTNATYPVSIDPTVDLQVGAGGDDGRRGTGSGFNSGVSDAYATGNWTSPSGDVRHGFMRFTSVTIPASSTITAADMEWKSCSSGFDGPGNIFSNIYLEDADNPVAPTTAGDFDGRVMTSAFTAYDEYDSNNDNWQNSPDIASVVQEVVDRGGWSSGNSMIVYWRDDGSDEGKLYCAHHYEASPAQAVQLHITYTEDGWTNTAPVIFQTPGPNETGHNISYSEYFNATDIDTNQTLWWSIATNLSSAGVEFDNRSAWVNSTPTFAERDASYYINITAADQGCGGGCNLTDYWNWTLYVNNTLPIITDGISTDEGGHNISYSEDFDFTDANSDTGAWAVNTNTTFLSVSGAGTVTGTPLFADRDASYYVNVTVRDYQGGQGGTDFTNYTLYINNTVPTITDKITTDEGGHNISYSEDFTPSDANSDTGIWSLVTNATFLSINSAGTVSGTPLFADRDSDYYVNATFRDYTGGQSGFDWTNYTLWVNNSLPSITDKITTDEGGHNISYSEDFSSSDANSDTGIWTLVTNASFLSINGVGTVSGTPLFADRDSTYYVNATFQDYIGGQSGSDWTNYTLWINNTVISISNPITDDTGVNGTAYSYNFNHADANSDTPDWNVTTDSPFTLTISASGVVSGTPDTVGTFWVNVTVQDYIGGQGGFDWVNYTLEITEEAVEVPIDFTTIMIFIAGVIPFSLAIAIGFWQRQAHFLFIGGLIGTLLGLWVIYSIFWIAGLSFIAISILFMYVGWINVETGNLG